MQAILISIRYLGRLDPMTWKATLFRKKKRLRLICSDCMIHGHPDIHTHDCTNYPMPVYLFMLAFFMGEFYELLIEAWHAYWKNATISSIHESSSQCMASADDVSYKFIYKGRTSASIRSIPQSSFENAILMLPMGNSRPLSYSCNRNSWGCWLHANIRCYFSRCSLCLCKVCSVLQKIQLLERSES